MNILDNYQSLIEAEAAHPRATVTNNILKKNKTVNQDYYDETKKKLEDYDKAAREETNDAITPPATTIEANNGTERYHDEIEASEDNLDLTYDVLNLSDSFKKRVKMAIEGDALMGNSPDWANVVPAQAGFTGPNFGKNLLKIKKDRVKDISQTPVKDGGVNGKQLGVTEKETAVAKFAGNQKGIKTQFSINKKDATSESTTGKKTINEALTEKGIETVKKWVAETDARTTAVRLVDQVLRKKIGLSSSDLADTAIFASGLDDIEELLEQGNYQEAYTVAKDTAEQMLEDEGAGGLFDENKKNDNKKAIKESTMKRLKFKSPFNGKDKAIDLIPESYKTDKKVFEMTDGNQSYQIRWEGDATKGNAVVLKEANQMFINEDMSKIKHLMNYNSKDTLGVVTGKQRVDENEVFVTTMSKAKALNESVDNKE